MDGETSTQGNGSRQPWADLSIPFGENVQTPGNARVRSSERRSARSASPAGS